MKKILGLLVFLVFFPVHSIAEDQQQCIISYDYWMCYQVGSLEEDIVLVVSDIATSPQSTCSERKTQEFIETIKKATNDKFVPIFSPRCEDYTNVKTAKKDLKRKIEIAKKRKLRIFHIKFSK